MSGFDLDGRDSEHAGPAFRSVKQRGGTSRGRALSAESRKDKMKASCVDVLVRARSELEIGQAAAGH